MKPELDTTVSDTRRPPGGRWWQVGTIWGGCAGIAMLFSIGLFVVFTPHLEPVDIRLYDLKRLLQVGLFAAAGLILVLSARSRELWLNTFGLLHVGVRVAIIVLLGLGLLSSLFAVDSLHAFLEVFHFGLLAISIVSVATIYRTRPRLVQQVLLGITTLAVGIYLLAFFRDYAYSQLGLSYSFRQRPNALWPWGEYLGFYHTRYFNQFQTWTLPLIVLPGLVFRTTRLGRFLLVAMPSFWWMLLFASGGRGTVLAVGLASVLILLFMGRRAVRYFLWMFTTAILGAILFFVLFKIWGLTDASLAERELAHSMGRFDFWQHAFQLIEHRPVLGIGPGQYAWFHHRAAAHPHNGLIQIFSEWGVVAGFTVGTLAVLGVVRTIGAIRKVPDVNMVSLGAIVALLAGLCHTMLSGLIVTPASQVLMVVVVGWVWGFTAVPISDETHRVIRIRQGWKSGGLVILTVLFLGGDTALTALSFRAHETRRPEIAENGHDELPRYWAYGCLWTHENRYPLLPEYSE